MKQKTKSALAGYLFILPSFLLLIGFSVFPIFMSFFYSFTQYNVFQPPVITGFENYSRMFKDPFVLASLKNTVIYTLAVVPIQSFLSMMLANLIADLFRNRYGNFVKSSLFIPVISSSILVGTIWSFFLATDGGVVNWVLSIFGIGKVNWFGQQTSALVGICIVSVWKNLGYFLVIFFAGILDIPRSIYEAAEVDGATGFQRFIYITFPSLKPITYLVVTLGTIWSFQVFDLVYLMTGGGPGTGTMTLVLTIYNAAFKEHNMGYACAIAFLLFAMVFVVSMLQRAMMKERKE